ncbi:hypothetical protein SAY86_011773 [Trapa natans]|uniref:Uncharacterized protein n=1 Tax=Trapa natans TaxID=22666 RepID=A0AAN7R4J3_TRANT|nr:hypothetical protein SAY86_011773 [Trapa natans]
MKTSRRSIQVLAAWVRRQPPKVKAFLAVVSGMAVLVFLRKVVHDRDNLFVVAEVVHALGISVLIYKLMKKKTCAGLSLKSQELTALFLAVRLYCSFVMEFDIHTLLDSATLATTLWVIYTIRFKLRSSYMEDNDNFATYYVVIPCAVLSLLIHPSTFHHLINRVCWAFCVYLETVSVLPQLRAMQNTKIVEPFTAHYVFALGIARFLSCAHWVLQVLDTRGRLLTALGYGMWPSMVLFSEIVQTFILADFCYYYVKSSYCAFLQELCDESPNALSNFLLLISVYFLQQLVQADNFAAVTVNGYAGGSSTSGLKIDCGGACAARCRLSSRPNLCKRACGTCCARCSCVPPGTYGNYDACPCYGSLTTRGNRRKRRGFKDLPPSPRQKLPAKRF